MRFSVAADRRQPAPEVHRRQSKFKLARDIRPDLPDGEAHAVMVGETETMCELRLVWLAEFPERDFEGLGPSVRKCPVCRQEVDEAQVSG
jgi:hypothetical protein